MAVAAHVERELCGAVSIDVFDCGHSNDDARGVIQHLIRSNTRVVGLQIFSDQVETCVRWARKIREKIPGIILIAGGHHPTLTWANFVTRHGWLFDGAVHGDGEAPFTEIVRRLIEGRAWQEPPIPGVGTLLPDGRAQLPGGDLPVVINTAANMLNARILGERTPLLFTDSWSGRARKAVAVTSSRSCPLKCSFCSIITMPGKWRATDNETLIAWLTAAYESEPFEHVYFMDANFFVVPRRVREFASLFSSVFPDATWSASSTVRMFLKMESDLDDLIASGLRMVELGIESGSARQLAILNKDVTVAENKRAVSLLQSRNLQIGLDYIMFFPDQTLSDLRENLRFLMESNLLLENGWEHYINALTLYPGTPLRDHYSKQLGREFDPDEVPKAEELFTNPDVLNVYRLFTRDFVAKWRSDIDGVQSRLVTAAQKLRARDGMNASRLILEAVALRHLPYHVLSALIETPTATSLDEAAPWLSSARQRIESLGESAVESLEAIPA